MDIELFTGEYDLIFYDYTVETFHETQVNVTEADPDRSVTLFIHTTYMFSSSI